MKYSRSAGLVFGLTVAAVAISALPSARYLPVEFIRPMKAVSVALPQGWAFFTKDPTKAADLAYVQREGVWVPVVHALPLTDATGISRRARAIDVEIAALAEAADGKFGSCPAGADIQSCAADAPHVRREFEHVDPPLCESILIRRMKPVPFAYGTRVVSMPSRMVIAHARCGS